MKYFLSLLLFLTILQLRAEDYPPLPLFTNPDLLYIKIYVPAYYDDQGVFHPSAVEWIATTEDVDVEEGQVMDDGCTVTSVYWYSYSGWCIVPRFYGNGYNGHTHRNQWWNGHHHEFHRQPTEHHEQQHRLPPRSITGGVHLNTHTYRSSHGKEERR